MSRYDELELGSQVTTRDAEQLVVDVGDDADFVTAGEPVHGSVRLPERLPVSHAVGQELGSRGFELPADLLGDLDARPAQDLGVELIRPAHHLGLDLEEALDQRRLVEAEAILVGLGAKRVRDPLLPVDQGSVAVRGHPLDRFERGKGHRYSREIQCCLRAIRATSTIWKWRGAGDGSL